MRLFKDQEWNPISNPPNQTEQNMDNPNNNTKQPQHGKRYSIEDNDIIKNVPTSQIKNVFNMINKKNLCQYQESEEWDIMMNI